MPPGPFGVPFLGYLPFLDPSAPHVTLSNLVKKYGKVFSVQMGQVPCVVVADPFVIKRCFAKNEYAGRAPLYLTHGMMKGYGLICAEGERWKIQRKFTASFMRRFGMSKLATEDDSRQQMEQRLLSCIKAFMDYVTDSKNEIDTTCLDRQLSHTIGNMMNEILFGYTYKEHDPCWQRIQKLREEGIKEIQVAAPVNFLPWLRHLVPKYKHTLDWMIAGKEETHKEYQRVIESCQNQVDNVAKSFLQEKERLNQENSSEEQFFCQSQLHHLLADIFGAGLDTTLTTLKWVLLYLCKYPETQETIWAEIQTKETTGFANMNQMPKTMAILLEIQRLCPVVPLGVPHGTMKEVQLENKWKLPKNCMVMVLHWHINRDPEYWDNPEEFLPQRFLNEQEDSLVIPPAFMPFQIGLRKCVGEDFGKAMVFLFSTHLVSTYKIQLASVYDLDQEPDPGFTRAPRPFSMKFTKRAS